MLGLIWIQTVWHWRYCKKNFSKKLILKKRQHMTNKHEKLPSRQRVKVFCHKYIYVLMGAQWLSGSVRDSRLRGRVFNPHWRHCVVSLSKNINSSLVLVQPRKTRPFITERLFMGRKESNKIFMPICLLPSLWTKSNQIYWVTCLHNWGVQKNIYFWGRPQDRWGRVIWYWKCWDLWGCTFLV